MTQQQETTPVSPFTHYYVRRPAPDTTQFKPEADREVQRLQAELEREGFQFEAR